MPKVRIYKLKTSVDTLTESRLSHRLSKSILLLAELLLGYHLQALVTWHKEVQLL